MARSDEGIAEEGELFRTHIGGAAVMEGIMMRGRLNWAVAVREPDGGIYVEEHDLKQHAPGGWRTWPIIRGCVSFVESMVLSFKAMEISSEHAYPDEDEDEEASEVQPTGQPPVEGAPKAKDQSDEESSSTGTMVAGIVIGLALGVLLFMALPVALANLIAGDYTTDNALVWNLVEAAVRVVIFVGYIWAIGRMPEIGRVFGYHGAEHETIHAFEHGCDLTPKACAGFSRLHVRCGTAFIIMTMIVAIIVNTLVPVAAWAESLGLTGFGLSLFVFGSRLALLPLVAGLSYEVTVRWAGSHPSNPLVKIVLWPGLQMQRLTTRTPDPGMLECAIEALGRVRAREQKDASKAC